MPEFGDAFERDDSCVDMLDDWLLHTCLALFLFSIIELYNFNFIDTKKTVISTSYHDI